MSYAVVWQQGHELPVAGRLDLGERELWLRGSNANGEVNVAVPYAEIVSAEREARLAAGAALRIESKFRGPLLLASLGGVGIVGEILEALRQMLV